LSLNLLHAFSALSLRSLDALGPLDLGPLDTLNAGRASSGAFNALGLRTFDALDAGRASSGAFGALRLRGLDAFGTGSPLRLLRTLGTLDLRAAVAARGSGGRGDERHRGNTRG
jgi:hypothetical protein